MAFFLFFSGLLSFPLCPVSLSLAPRLSYPCNFQNVEMRDNWASLCAVQGQDIVASTPQIPFHACWHGRSCHVRSGLTPTRRAGTLHEVPKQRF
ncbi:hypothetical protein COO60DRAFT_738267 [Scenedesmus sp. NREL 46B-D3]|nr:hypothetical protein COO60DRAFT_738267 [Scenedesmus sp. NREL 46B-D3]